MSTQADVKVSYDMPRSLAEQLNREAERSGLFASRITAAGMAHFLAANRRERSRMFERLSAFLTETEERADPMHWFWRARTTRPVRIAIVCTPPIVSAVIWMGSYSWTQRWIACGWNLDLLLTPGAALLHHKQGIDRPIHWRFCGISLDTKGNPRPGETFPPEVLDPIVVWKHVPDIPIPVVATRRVLWGPVLRVPLWFLFIVCTMFALVSMRHLLCRPRLDDGVCNHCGYSLTGNVSGVCPECGTAVAPAPQPPADTATR